MSMIPRRPSATSEVDVVSLVSHRIVPLQSEDPTMWPPALVSGEAGEIQNCHGPPFIRGFKIPRCRKTPAIAVTNPLYVSPEAPDRRPSSCHLTFVSHHRQCYHQLKISSPVYSRQSSSTGVHSFASLYIAIRMVHARGCILVFNAEIHPGPVTISAEPQAIIGSALPAVFSPMLRLGLLGYTAMNNTVESFVTLR